MENDTTGNEAPSFFSAAFHIRFFPTLLFNRLRPWKNEYQSPFASHVPMELTLSLVVSGVVLATAMPYATEGSILGWIGVVVGMSGLLALLAHSVRTVWGIAPSYRAFRVAMFLFFVMLGVTIGLFAGRDFHFSLIIAAALGGVAGYMAGIAAGLWVQRLGWVAPLLDLLAIGGIAGMAILDWVLLQ